MAKIKFYYLQDFYNEKSEGIIGIYRDSEGNNVSAGQILEAATNNDTVILEPASKRQLAKADKELLIIIKNEGYKKEN